MTTAEIKAKCDQVKTTATKLSVPHEWSPRDIKVQAQDGCNSVQAWATDCFLAALQIKSQLSAFGISCSICAANGKVIG